jgi:hypothetical protein
MAMRERLAFAARRGWRIAAVLPVGFALLTASGFAGDAPISADLGDVGFFTAHAAELFAKAIPKAKVEIKAPLALLIDVNSARLDNIYSFCLRNPEACEKGLIAHVANMAASFEAPGGIERSQLRAIVRSTAMAEATDKAYARRGGTTVSEKLMGDLWVMCAQDLPGAVGILNANNLAALNLSREGALAACKQNVAASLGPLRPYRRDYPWPGVNLAAGDPYAASWLIFPDRWTAIAESVGGDLLVAAPANDALIYGSGRANDSAAALAKAAAYVAERAHKPLSNAVLRWTPTRWEAVEP